MNNSTHGKGKNPASNSKIKIYYESLSRGNIYIYIYIGKKRKGQPCLTNWKKSTDTQLNG